MGEDFRKQLRDVAPEHLRVMQGAERVLQLRQVVDENVGAGNAVGNRLDQIPQTLDGNARLMCLGSVADR